MWAAKPSGLGPCLRSDMSCSLKPVAAILGLALAVPVAALIAPAPGRAAQPSPAPTTPAGPGNPAVSAPRNGQAQADLQTCFVAVAARGRYATFAAQMTQVSGGRRMAIRIGLRERTPQGHGYRALSAPGLGVWRRSSSGVHLYRYVKQVFDLPAPATLRGAVDFRWLDAHGHVIRRARRLTSPCAQPDERPRLTVGAVTVAPGPGSLNSYRVVVRDDGRGPANSFVVALAVNGQPAGARAVDRLGAAEVTSLTVEGPRCVAGGAVQITLDPARHVQEAPGGGLARTLACPLPQAPTGAAAP